MRSAEIHIAVPVSSTQHPPSFRRQSSPLSSSAAPLSATRTPRTRGNPPSERYASAMPPSSGGRGSRLNRLSSALAPARRPSAAGPRRDRQRKTSRRPGQTDCRAGETAAGKRGLHDRAAGGQRQLPETAACKIQGSRMPGLMHERCRQEQRKQIVLVHTPERREQHPEAVAHVYSAHATALSGNPPGRAPRRFARSPDADGDRLHCRSDRHGQSRCRS